ncbi:MAG: UDP-glucose 4-epimerase GalE [Betaproteobacteria bacterium]|nr:MAG: UDP-glucose 4-epimerase GalE [Betaproteobacteria bacterium]
MKGTILVTGGLGYIGSHTCVALAEAGYALVIVDNLANSKLAVLDRLREIAPKAQIDFHKADIRDAAALGKAFSGKNIEAVIHFAGLKAVGESVEKPLLYYENNVGGTVTLLAAMAKHGVHRLVFSSSATVYGEPEKLPIPESHPLRPQNPYGKTKLIVEHLLVDDATSDSKFRYAALRYFNPTGAHASGRIGEDPNGIPNNLFPYIAQVAVGRRPALRVWGKDYPTVDGTGVRDYIHVVDLAEGHVAALQYLQEKDSSLTVNLGSGRGYSVLEAVHAFERASGKRIPLEFATRRPGDVASCFANPSLAASELRWKTRFGIDEMCRDVWRWQSANPNGYP